MNVNTKTAAATADLQFSIMRQERHSALIRETESLPLPACSSSISVGCFSHLPGSNHCPESVIPAEGLCRALHTVANCVIRVY
jgi:hypothetical protein